MQSGIGIWHIKIIKKMVQKYGKIQFKTICLLLLSPSLGLKPKAATLADPTDLQIRYSAVSTAHISG
jgi:hypothetical protein